MIIIEFFNRQSRSFAVSLETTFIWTELSRTLHHVPSLSGLSASGVNAVHQVRFGGRTSRGVENRRVVPLLFYSTSTIRGSCWRMYSGQLLFHEDI